MSLVPGIKDMHNPAIDNLVQASLRLEWISHEEITDIKPTQVDNVYNATRKYTLDDGEVKEMITLLCLGNSGECTQILVSEFARIYSLPTHTYNNGDSHFRRYKGWLDSRNGMIKGFTKSNDKYYMVADREFYYCYTRYGFCTACVILRCSPVWCICGHKELSDGWTSNDKQLDEFIKKSQLQTNSPNDAYLEWIPFDYINDREYGLFLSGLFLNGLPICRYVKLIPLEITDETRNLYYAEVNYLFMHHVY